MREARVLGLLMQPWTKFNTITPIYQSTTTWQAKISSSNLALVVKRPGNKEISNGAILCESNMTAATKAGFRGD